MSSETIFQEAERIVGGERRQDYGDVRESFTRIAKAWSAVLPCDVTAEQVALCMIGLKLVRESNAHKRDNLVDICGYTLCIERMGVVCGAEHPEGGTCQRNPGHTGNHGRTVREAVSA